MGVPRLAAVALLACVLFAAPAQADGSSESSGTGPCDTCDDGSAMEDNSTSSQANTTQSPPDPVDEASSDAAETYDDVASGQRCDVVRPTGNRPQASINPVLGLVTVNPGCVLTNTKAVVYHSPL